MSSTYYLLPLAVWVGPDSSLLRYTGEGFMFHRKNILRPWVNLGGPVTLEEAQQYAASYGFKEVQVRW